MSIDYYGHSALPIAQTQQRIVFLRRKKPNWYGVLMELTDARLLSSSGIAIARGFGIEAQSGFGLYLLDRARLAEHDAAVEFVYEVFGTDDLVISFGMDSIRPPLNEYKAITIDEL